ncbi:MAG: S1C family serine protease [Woeseiaceae bacterium]
MTSHYSKIVSLAVFAAANFAHAQSNVSPLSTEALFERVNGSVCTIASTDQGNGLLRRGSGFILKDSGLLATNAHVLAGFEQAEVSCGDQTTEIRRIVKYDGKTDLVLVETGPLIVAGLELSSSKTIRPGTQVYAFGSPYGLTGTITPGLTSGYRELEGKTYIQISTAISPGSSGGPITDGNGAVIGISVAALEVAQNINFAIPAKAIDTLPDVDLALAELSARGQRPQYRSTTNLAPPPPRQDTPVAQRPPPESDPQPQLTASRAEFRGYAYGSQCGEIAIKEYERSLHWSSTKGLTEFPPVYGGELEMDIELLGAPATVFFRCDERYGLVGGRYEIMKHQDAVAKIESEISRKYGAGTVEPISEYEARDLGCRFNFSLPGSRFYNPSQRTLWNGDDGVRVELLVCGGTSHKTFVFMDDTALLEVVNQQEQQASLHDIF